MADNPPYVEVTLPVTLVLDQVAGGLEMAEVRRLIRDEFEGTLVGGSPGRPIAVRRVDFGGAAVADAQEQTGFVIEEARCSRCGEQMDHWVDEDAIRLFCRHCGGRKP